MARLAQSSECWTDTLAGLLAGSSSCMNVALAAAPAQQQAHALEAQLLGRSKGLHLSNGTKGGEDALPDSSQLLHSE